MTRLLIRLVLMLYPREYRRAYGQEILEVAMRRARLVPLRELAALALGGSRQRFRQERSRPARAVTIVLTRPLLMAVKALGILMSGSGIGALLAQTFFREKLGTMCQSYCVDVHQIAATPMQWALCLVVGVVLCTTTLQVLATAHRHLRE